MDAGEKARLGKEKTGTGTELLLRITAAMAWCSSDGESSFDTPMEPLYKAKTLVNENKN